MTWQKRVGWCFSGGGVWYPNAHYDNEEICTKTCFKLIDTRRCLCFSPSYSYHRIINIPFTIRPTSRYCLFPVGKWLKLLIIGRPGFFFFFKEVWQFLQLALFVNVQVTLYQFFIQTFLTGSKGATIKKLF